MTSETLPDLPIFKAVAAELETVDAFLELLAHERNALIGNLLAELERIVPDKTFMAQKLEQLAKERKRLFDINHVEIANTSGHEIRNALSLSPEDLQNLNQLWQSLLAKAREANDANALNGKLIENRHQQTRQLLKLLKASRTPLVYDALGQPQAPNRGLLNDKV